MKITLRKIKKSSFDDLRKLFTQNFELTGALSLSEEIIESNSETIFINGNPVELEVDIEKYLAITQESTFGYTKFAQIGMELHNDLKSDIADIPRNVFYEKEFWAYLSLTAFNDVVKELRLRDTGSVTENKIKQFYFNAGEISRTGLMFLWVMVDRLNAENDFEITHTAFEFVDPVKAVLERTMSKNSNIIKAFVQGIINNNKDSRFKNDKFRSKVPSHISCYASVNVLDALEYDELVEVITEQQKAIISEK